MMRSTARFLYLIKQLNSSQVTPIWKRVFENVKNLISFVVE